MAFGTKDRADGGPNGPNRESRSAADDSDQGEGIPLLRARSKAKEFRAKFDELHQSVEQLGLLSTVDLEQRQPTLETEIDRLTAEIASERADAVASVEREAA